MMHLENYEPVEIQRCYLNQLCNPNQTVNKALAIIYNSPEHYNLLTYNCQDFVNQATTGQKGSYQRDTLLGVLALTLGVVIIGNLISNKRLWR